MSILICHTGTDTWFHLEDSGYLISESEAQDNDADGDLELGNNLADIAVQHGYPITPELAARIYELVVNYYKETQ